MRVRVGVVVMRGSGKDAIMPLPSTTATVNNATIGTVGSIPPPLPLTTTVIAAANDRHRRCHTVNNNNHQKPVVVVCHQRRQRLSLFMEVVVDGGRGNGGLH
jgi:hypothetical protein